jgi:predicted anti-sigma-YlaC factor YlaD
MNCREAIDLVGNVLEGELESDLQAGFDQHIRACAPCRNYLEHLRLTREALRLLPPNRATSPNRRELIERFQDELGD